MREKAREREKKRAEGRWRTRTFDVRGCPFDMPHAGIARVFISRGFCFPTNAPTATRGTERASLNLEGFDDRGKRMRNVKS